MNGEKDGTVFNPITFGRGAVSRDLPDFPDPVLFTFNENKKVTKNPQKVQSSTKQHKAEKNKK